MGLDKNIKDPKVIKSYIWNLYKKKNWKTQGFSTASNVIVDRMNIGDYVWTRSEGIYWIAKILEESKYIRNNEEYVNYDIGFCRKVKYSETGFHESEVPGKVISSFSARNSTQNVEDKSGRLYKYTDSLFTGEKNLKIRLEDWIIFFSANDIEEIIGLYLQVEKKLYIYTSTNKKSTAKIEFELIDREGNLYGVQVKTGHVSLNGDDYSEISEKMKIFLFATSDRVIIGENKNLIHIRVKEITEFIEQNKKLLPERISRWLK